MSNIKRTERGWPGHFICADRCLYRRNTLLESATRKVIVSTVGNFRRVKNSEIFIECIGYNRLPRYYETMAFEAELNGAYYDIDTAKPVSFHSHWAICAASADELPDDVDNQADAMHEIVVEEISNMLKLDS